MAVVRNLVANSLNQGVSFLTSILAVPIYLSQLGIEQYGLIGFAIVVQMWVNLLEVGMSGTLGREMTRLMIGDVSETSVHSFVRSLDWLFLAALIALPTVGWLCRDWWAQEWFTSHKLAPAVINECVVLIIALAAVRLAATLYRGGLMGFDRQVFVSAVSIVSSVSRLALPLPFIWAFPDVRIVVGAWLIISTVELVFLRISLSRAFSSRFHWRHFSIAELRQRAHLWGSIGYLSIAWTAITQTDKLILSRVLPLADYGRFTLVMILSNAVLTLTTPINFAFQPRMTAAATQGNRQELAQLVRDSTRLIMVLIVAPAFALAAAPALAIIGWTGRPGAAYATAAYLGPYVIGSAFASFAGIAYLIQYAYGDLRLQVRAYTLFAVILIPGEIVVATRFGPLGASWLWLIVNVLTLLIYCPLVIRRFLPGEAGRWLGFIVLAPAVASAAAAWAMGLMMGDHWATRPGAIFATAATVLGGCAAASAVTLGLAFGERRTPQTLASPSNSGAGPDPLERHLQDS
jgi:O-antigen/teichoic acid export membrane protein